MPSNGPSQMKMCPSQPNKGEFTGKSPACGCYFGIEQVAIPEDISFVGGKDTIV